MEKNIQIKTNDNHLIYGILNSGKIYKKLIIFVHGLTGHKNEHQFYNAAKFFPKNGFATFRFDLYSGEKRGRALSECTIETHSLDLNTVINHFKDDYNQIYLVGHSLGGPAILLAKTDLVDSIVLWDPSFNILEGLSNKLKFDSRINKYILKWGTEYLLSKEMVESWKKLGDELLNYFQKPTKIICAGQGILHKSWKKKLQSITADHEFCIIQNAGHCFDEKETESDLFAETLKWFRR
jgi:esterase/lipase